MRCAYCERPLMCAQCGAEYVPPTPEAYAAVQACDVAVACPTCEEILVCRWCGSVYDGTCEPGDEPTGEWTG
ncbi:MAG: hypothetical protein KatS3mg108_0959 [Isosphaeraceae bacterium]|jgi:hypothetical protein|nr:MAG: hypothetical protein KatS3mg108_0959 [Isosphaeraceae bacterium]